MQNIIMQTARAGKRQKRLSEQSIRNILKEYEASGETVIQFCQTRSINSSSFHRWRGKYQEGEGVKRRATFVPVNITAQIDKQSNEPALFAEVHGIRLYKEMPADYLITLLNR